MAIAAHSPARVPGGTEEQCSAHSARAGSLSARARRALHLVGLRSSTLMLIAFAQCDGYSPFVLNSHLFYYRTLFSTAVSSLLMLLFVDSSGGFCSAFHRIRNAPLASIRGGFSHLFLANHVDHFQGIAIFSITVLRVHLLHSLSTVDSCKRISL